MMQPAKATILDITPYKPGESTLNYQGEILKLSSNETPYGPSPKAIAVYQDLSNSLGLYPEGTSAVLRKAITGTYGLNADNIVCGAGSDEIISMLCQAFTAPGDEVVYSQYGFLMYAIYAKVAGAVPVEAPAKGLATDVDALLAAVTEKTKLVFIASPNNPTGTYNTKDELVRLRKALPEEVILVLDGAYAEYVDAPDYSNGSELVEAHDNVVMLRTFSKIYGLAALRVGWGYASAKITNILNRVRGPFNVSAPAMLAAAAAVEDTAYTEQVKQQNNAEIKRIAAALANYNVTCHPTAGNFYLISFDDQNDKAQTTYQSLRDNGIITRAMNSYDLPNALRITVGTKEQNDRVLRVLAKDL